MMSQRKQVLKIGPKAINRNTPDRERASKLN